LRSDEGKSLDQQWHGFGGDSTAVGKACDRHEPKVVISTAQTTQARPAWLTVP
jgi:hypothetical protein